MIVYTKEAETKTYNQNGKVHGSSPIRGIRTPLTVSTTTRDVPERGECYQILSTGAFILVADVTTDAVIPPPPPPPTGDELPAYFTAHAEDGSELGRYNKQ